MLRRYLTACAALAAMLAPSAWTHQALADNVEAPSGTQLAPAFLFHDTQAPATFVMQNTQPWNLPSDFLHSNFIAGDKYQEGGSLILSGGAPIINDANSYTNLNSKLRLIDMGGTCGKVWVMNLQGSTLKAKAAELYGIDMGDLESYTPSAAWFVNHNFFLYPDYKLMAEASKKGARVLRVRMEVNLYDNAAATTAMKAFSFGRDDQNNFDEADYNAADAARMTPAMFLDAQGNWDATRWAEYEFEIPLRVTPDDLSEWNNSTAIKLDVSNFKDGALLVRNIYVWDPYDEATYADHTAPDATLRSDLKFNTYTVGAPEADLKAPAAPTDMRLVVQPELVITGSVVSPAMDQEGYALSSIDCVKIARNGQVIKAYENPAPNTTLFFNDQVEAEGPVTYSAWAVNDHGEGPKVEASVYAGVGQPTAPIGAAVMETQNPGEVLITWTAPDLDAAGAAIPADALTYSIYDGDTMIADGLTECSYVHRAIDPSEQAFVRYDVYAHTLSGRSEYPGRTNILALGAAASVPYVESFAGAQPQNPLFTEAIYGMDNPSWRYYNDSQLSACQSQDGDNGFAAFVGEIQMDAGCLYTTKISLRDVENPVLKFYVFGYYPDRNANQIEVSVDANASGDYQSVSVTGVNDLVPDKWNRVIVPLTDYAGGDVSLRFLGLIQSQKYLHVDNITITSQASLNLAAEEISGPERVRPGSPFVITGSVLNAGAQDVGSFDVALECNGTEIARQEGMNIAPAEKQTFTFPVEVSIFDGLDHNVYTVVAIAQGDEVASDNRSEGLDIPVLLPTYPRVDDLQGNVDGEGNATLMWSVPVIDHTSQEYTEDFENGSHGDKSYEGWKFVDRDFGYVDNSANLPIPGMTTGDDRASFVVVDATVTGNEQLTAHSGNKCLLAMANLTGANGDWAISPELSGNEQELSLWARAFSDNYPENFDIYWSEGSLSPFDFHILERKENIGQEWTKYSFVLPEGAKRFAIAYTSDRKFIFLVDDVTYEPVGAYSANIYLKGYNIYRDRQKINNALVTEPAYTDASSPTTEATYAVSAVYSEGESLASNEVTLKGLAGVENVAVDGSAAPAVQARYTPDGRQVSNSATGVVITRYSDGTATKTVNK